MNEFSIEERGNKIFNFKQKEDEITYSDVHAATRNEISEINQFLNSGFYIE